MRWKLSSSHSPGGAIPRLAGTAAFSSSPAATRRPSLRVKRASRRSPPNRGRRPGRNLCPPAKVLPCPSIWSALYSAERRGASGAACSSVSLCSCEATLVLFRRELAREEGEKQPLQLLLLDEATRLMLLNQQHGVGEGVAQPGFLHFP